MDESRLDKIINAYNELGLKHSFDESILKEILNIGTIGIELRLEQENINQLDKAGITSLKIREDILRGSWERFQRFKTIVTESLVTQK